MGKTYIEIPEKQPTNSQENAKNSNADYNLQEYPQNPFPKRIIFVAFINAGEQRLYKCQIGQNAEIQDDPKERKVSGWGSAIQYINDHKQGLELDLNQCDHDENET